LQYELVHNLGRAGICAKIRMALREIAILSGCAEIPVAQLDRARRHRESRNIEKSSVRRSIKKKAGGRYAADLVLQLPARGSGSVAMHCGY
jgi:hypothetical protein